MVLPSESYLTERPWYHADASGWCLVHYGRIPCKVCLPSQLKPGPSHIFLSPFGPASQRQTRADTGTFLRLTYDFVYVALSSSLMELEPNKVFSS
jgi:hypothetical protein